jgi:hypothetical protein
MKKSERKARGYLQNLLYERSNSYMTEQVVARYRYSNLPPRVRRVFCKKVILQIVRGRLLTAKKENQKAGPICHCLASALQRIVGKGKKLLNRKLALPEKLDLHLK